MGLLSKIVSRTSLDKMENTPVKLSGLENGKSSEANPSESSEAKISESSEVEPSGSSEVETIINDFFDLSGAFNCCIFNTALDEETLSRINLAVKNFGRLLHLRGNTCILLFPASVDHELLLHHLDKRFQLNIIEQFSTDTPQKVFGSIQKYR